MNFRPAALKNPYSIALFTAVNVLLSVYSLLSIPAYRPVHIPEKPPTSTAVVAALPQPTQSPEDPVAPVTGEPAPRNSIAVAPTPTDTLSHIVIERLINATTFQAEDGSIHPLQIYTPLLTPNDPQSGQWWETSLGLPAAWDLGTGSSDTTLAIIDTGFGLQHEEFSGRWHINSGESGAAPFEAASRLNCTDRSLPLNQSCNLIDDDYDTIVDNESGSTTEENSSQYNCTDQTLPLDKACNLVDDDGNGYVDDVTGWDFYAYDRSVQAGEINPYGSGVRHGTYVAGVAAANANNGVGIAGVNWYTNILPVQALGDAGSGNSLSVARAIRYAVAQGADVISLSLGTPYADTFLHQTITDAIKQGVIVVAAAGNSGCNCISYPANYQEVVAVGALQHNNTPASFSSYGQNLDVLAPGVGLYTASWSPANQTSLYASGISGTSLATPLISGALTLLKSHLPDASNQVLLATLLENTDRLGLASSQNRSQTLGFGTLDLAAAVNRAQTTHTHTQAVGFSGISYGSALFTQPLEQGDLMLIVCSADTYGASAIYSLSKNNVRFYTASESEAVRAQLHGYTIDLLGYFCTQQSHDTAAEVRILNPSAEFENQFYK